MTTVALITGGSKGIGFAIAEELAKKSYTLVLTARTEADLHAATEKLTSKYGVKVTVVPADLTQSSSYELLRSHLESEYGKLDLLVNNAGDFKALPFADEKGGLRNHPHELAHDVAALFAVNTLPPAALAHILRDLQLRSPSPQQLDVLSSAALEIFPGNNPYGLTKVAHERLSLSVAAETAGRIRTVRVYPSNTDTRMVKHFTVPKLTPQEVAQAAVELLFTANTDCYLKKTEKGIVQGIAALKYSKHKRADGTMDGLTLVQEHRELLAKHLLPAAHTK